MKQSRLRHTDTILLNSNSFCTSNDFNEPASGTHPQYIPPWTEPYIIGVAGTSGSGKTSVAKHIVKAINQPWTVVLSLDNFYKVLTPEQHILAEHAQYDLDSPTALDFDLMLRCIGDLKTGKPTQLPVYDFCTHSRTEKTTTIYGASVIVVEGLLALHHGQLLDLMDTKVFVDTDLDICMARRVKRDLIERGRDLEGILDQWDRHVKPNTIRYVIPSSKNADLILPRSTDNKIALDMIIRHINNQLEQKSLVHLKRLQELGQISNDETLMNRIARLPLTNQLKCISTILFDRETSRTEFIFYFDRVANMLIHLALEQVEFGPSQDEVLTPQYHCLTDAIRPLQSVVVVTMVRTGDVFMNSIRKTIPDVRVGKLLIQSDLITGEPQLHTKSLPPCEQTTKLLLFDAHIISGAAAIMGIQVLLDHGIEEGNIVIVSYLAEEAGLRRILNAFQKVTIIVGLSSGRMTSLLKEPMFRTRFIDDYYFGST
ncbi:Uridine kinase [Komagataella phaffii CBS 7435]|uniref:Uridine kinase n=2 Tax=Komagataella phaffii TaxID=460519 RepID=C4R1Q0_KOMPG|nr:Uridine/cytidine kinase, component of the pyrimidine ribonucleotide salvage pathway [Komagataella phaffii GS115]AOA62796.1 GQ67_00840T0 [Komagataella phaffii]CAH2448041.1 Uridine kinase [Komagataella phaffii CBS 7435]AOA68012.1 GQ68_00549T0 [Komagataella phaffii GS115]CAY69424.1 Uridine/cytidine kinase, component of the pyrimidine ribonucleotide salvage pathway [Komagataella phaffii GS115]CCA38190.1 Uridine kinase [Komagataella phaffii CBS 7435]